MPLLQLPSEILLKIASYLNPSSLFELIISCRDLYTSLLPTLLAALALEDKVDGLSPIIYALKENYLGLFRACLAQRAIDPQSEDLQFAFISVSLHGFLDWARLLLDYGVRPRPECLGWAIAFQQADMANFLLDLGIGPNTSCDAGRWPYDMPILLHLARDGNAQMMELLLDRGADVNIRNEWRSSALTLAAEYGHVECVELLLERGADVGTIDRDGATAWSLAVDWERQGIIELLKDTGAEEVEVTCSDVDDRRLLPARGLYTPWTYAVGPRFYSRP